MENLDNNSEFNQDEATSTNTQKEGHAPQPMEETNLDQENEHTQEQQVQQETDTRSIQEEVVEEDKKETKQEEATNPTKEKKAPFLKRHQNATLLSGCLLLGVVGGVSGSLLANQFSDNKTILYQSTSNGSSSNTSSGNATNMSVKDVADKTMNSVVEIKTESIKTNEYYQQAISSGAGSGVILSKDGYIVTNHHVIDGANKITVTTKDGKQYSAKLIGSDASTDLAVLKIEASNLSAATLGKSSELEVGEPAIAIGNPLGELGGTVTNGIISALDREVTIDNEKMHLLQTNAAINPGNSGGGLFNAEGELIGVVNAKSRGSNIEGLGFAIPIDIAKPVIESLIQNGKVQGRAELGVTLTEYAEQGNPFEESQGTRKYVYIYNVQKGKAADKAGLQRGDKVLKADGKEINEIADLKTIINGHKAGDKMTMVIERDGQEKTITITLLEVSTDTAEKTNYQG